MVAILVLKVKTMSNCKTDIKYDFLDPKNPSKVITHYNFSQTIDKQIFEVSEWGHFGYSAPTTYAHTFERDTSYFLI